MLNDYRVNQSQSSAADKILSFSSKPGLIVFPHRGVTYFGAPENSRLSLYHAYLMGATMVEFDVRYTSDGYFILSHDETANVRFENSDGSPIGSTKVISEITLAEMLTFRHQSTYDGYKVKVDLLEDFLRDCARYNITPFMEIKGAMPSSLDNSLIAITRKYFKDNQVVFQSFEDAVVKRICKKAEYYPVFNSGNIELAKSMNGGIFISSATINQPLMDNARTAKISVFGYTVDTLSEYNRLLALGVHGVTSNIIAGESNSKLTYVDNWNSLLSFEDATVSNGTNYPNESLVVLNNTGYVQSPNLAAPQNGVLTADIFVVGSCTVQYWVAGVLYETITNVGTGHIDHIKIQRNLNISEGNTCYIKIIASEANVKVVSIKAETLSLPFSIDNKFRRTYLRSDIGFGVKMKPTRPQFVHLKGASTTPAIATWDPIDVAAYNAFSDIDNNIEYNAGLASNQAIYKAAFIGRRSRGTLAAPAAVASGDNISGFFGSGFDGSVFRSHASVETLVDGAVSSGNVPMALSFQSGITSRAEGARLSPGRKFLIGTAIDDGTNLLQVAGPGKFTGALAIGNAVSVSAATASTHKASVVIGGVQYYFLLTT